MDYEEIERKKQKLLRWLEIGAYLLAGLAIAAKVLPIFWRMMT